jgi:hypothetical protein
MLGRYPLLLLNTHLVLPRNMVKKWTFSTSSCHSNQTKICFSPANNMKIKRLQALRCSCRFWGNSRSLKIALRISTTSFSSWYRREIRAGKYFRFRFPKMNKRHRRLKSTKETCRLSCRSLSNPLIRVVRINKPTPATTRLEKTTQHSSIAHRIWRLADKQMIKRMGYSDFLAPVVLSQAKIYMQSWKMMTSRLCFKDSRIRILTDFIKDKVFKTHLLM